MTMVCQNCGENEANVKYTQIVNGNKQEMNLCEECAENLGITKNIKFDMGMDFPSFLGGFLNEYNSFLPNFATSNAATCPECEMTYEDFVNTGKFGCASCYDVFSDRIDPILKNIQGSNRHLGRKAKIFPDAHPEKVKRTEASGMEELQEQLKQAIKEERYEEAASIRDQIKKLEK